MKPNLSGALKAWEVPYTIKTVSVTTVDFVETEVVTGRTQQCVIQPADPEKINPDTVDWSLEYILVHSRSAIGIDELIEYDGRDFRVSTRGAWGAYGFWRVIAEETNRPPKEVTE